MLYAIKNTDVRDSSVDMDALVACFTEKRRSPEDVYWLKENAELLRVLVCADIPVPVDSLMYYQRFYQEAAQRLQFFPQYYRFILSICCDLEALGLKGDTYSILRKFVRTHDLAAGELSDLQRLESQWLLSANGKLGLISDALTERIRQFCVNAGYFAIPNRKAAFELTHAVFYASGYGTVLPDWLPDAESALLNAGMVAMLDDDVDLVSEVLVALRYCGVEPPFYWQQVARAAHGSVVATEPGKHVPGSDFYHEALTLGWAETLAGGTLLANGFEPADSVFTRGSRMRQQTPLRELSSVLWRYQGKRPRDWEAFLSESGDALSDTARANVHALKASCDGFEAFFQHFSRSVPVCTCD